MFERDYFCLSVYIVFFRKILLVMPLNFFNNIPYGSNTLSEDGSSDATEALWGTYISTGSTTLQDPEATVVVCTCVCVCVCACYSSHC